MKIILLSLAILLGIGAQAQPASNNVDCNILGQGGFFDMNDIKADDSFYVRFFRYMDQKEISSFKDVRNTSIGFGFSVPDVFENLRFNKDKKIDKGGKTYSSWTELFEQDQSFQSAFTDQSKIASEVLVKGYLECVKLINNKPENLSSSSAFLTRIDSNLVKISVTRRNIDMRRPIRISKVEGTNFELIETDPKGKKVLSNAYTEFIVKLVETKKIASVGIKMNDQQFSTSITIEPIIPNKPIEPEKPLETYRVLKISGHGIRSRESNWYGLKNYVVHLDFGDEFDCWGYSGDDCVNYWASGEEMKIGVKVDNQGRYKAWTSSIHTNRTKQEGPLQQMGRSDASSSSLSCVVEPDITDPWVRYYAEYDEYERRLELWNQNYGAMK